MHRSILGVALCAALTSPPGARAACPQPGAAVVERFTSADCTDCWSASDPATSAGWLFDWIVPAPAGDEAPMSAAAPPESRERVLRSGASSPTAQQVTVQRSTLPARGAPQLKVQIGPAWYGYFALQLTVRGRVPPGATGWLALVEDLPAGTDGSGVARELVRAVAGPLPLNTPATTHGRALTHLGALRIPETAKAERLHARGWIESAEGRLLAVTSDACSRSAGRAKV